MYTFAYDKYQNPDLRSKEIDFHPLLSPEIRSIRLSIR